MRKLAVLALLGSLISVSLSAATPYLVKDINQNLAPVGSYPDDFVSFGNLALFTTNDSASVPKELWRTDGTEAGTFKLGGVPESVVVWNGKAWFTSGGLWSTDGTVAGTQKLTLPAATPALAPSFLMAGPAHLYFFNAGKLWRTDGTTAGTTQLTNTVLTPGRMASYALRSWYGSIGPVLCFLADSNGSGVELWKVDGNGTVSQVKDFASDTISSAVALEGLIYLHKPVASGFTELWRSDGTAAGTYPLQSGGQPIRLTGTDELVSVNGLVYFSGRDTVTQRLFRTAGTDASLAVAATSLPGVSSSFNARVIGRLPNGTILLLGPKPVGSAFGYTFWSFNGTTTTLLANVYTAGSMSLRATVAGTYATFGIGAQLWRSDGTVGGTYKLTELITRDDWPMAAAGSKVVVGGADAVHGVELWQTDGTIANTTLVKDILQGTYGSMPAGLTPFRGGVLFDVRTDASDGAIQPPRELWFSDGTEAGTRKLMDDRTAAGMVPCGTRAFFSRTTPESGQEPWVTDGTAAGTVLLRDIFPGDSSSPYGFTCVDGIMLFYARSRPNGAELWRSDGTAAGTILVKSFDANVQGSYQPLQTPVRLGHQVYLATLFQDFSSTGRLWRSDGTPGGTVMIKEFPDAAIRVLTTAGNRLYVTTSGSSYPSLGYTLWRSDGTDAGTVSLASDWEIDQQTRFYDRLTYRVQDSPGSGSFCTTDGTNAGTCYPFAPIAAPIGGRQFSMLPMNGRLFYNGSDLRSTDGASELRSQIDPAERIFTVGGGLLYGRGDVQSSGTIGFLETDGTLAGTRRLVDSATDAAISAGRVFMAADELYALDSDATPIAFLPASVAAPGGQTITISGRGLTAPVTIKVGGISTPVGTVTPTSITFTAPQNDPGWYEVEVSLGSGQRVILDQPLVYTCSTPMAVAATPASACPLTPVTLQGSGGTRCAWFPETGLDDPSSCTPKATVATTTTYSLMVFTANGCQSVNTATATVTILPPVDGTITIPGVPDGHIESNTAYTASVPDAGAGATYVWAANGITISSGQNTRTVAFKTSCAFQSTLSVTITNAGGCTGIGSRTFFLTTPLLSSSSPDVAHPGTVITIKGTGLDCAPDLYLYGVDELYRTAYTRVVPHTPVDRTTVRVVYPGDALRKVSIGGMPGIAQTLLRADRRDFNRDIRGDVFWRNSATGASSVWTLNGATFAGLVSLSVPRAWTLAAIGDFDGDGRADVFWHNPTTGETSIWLMNGANPSATVRSTTVPVGWKPVGSGDFNGDGKADLFWHNPNSGETSIWFMNGVAVGSAIRSLTILTAWRPATFGDFNADGKGDILWTCPATGETSIWLMNGTGTPATAVRSDTLPAPWTLAGSADFNGDRKDDLFWHNPTTGETQLWHLDGAVIAGKSTPLTMPTSFVPAVLAHFDTGSAADVLWYNPTTGDTSVWLRNISPAGGPASGPVTPLYRVPDTNWRPVILR